MKQKSIASFFSKPAGGAGPAPKAKAEDAHAGNCDDAKPEVNAPKEVEAPTTVESDKQTTAAEPTGKLRRLRRGVVEDEPEEQPARLSLEDNLEDDVSEAKDASITVPAAEEEGAVEEGPAPKKRKLDTPDKDDSKSKPESDSAPPAEKAAASNSTEKQTETKVSPSKAAPAASIFLPKSRQAAKESGDKGKPPPAAKGTANNSNAAAKNSKPNAKGSKAAEKQKTTGGNKDKATGKSASGSKDKKSEGEGTDKKSAGEGKDKKSEGESVGKKSEGESGGKKSEGESGGKQGEELVDAKEDEEMEDVKGDKSDKGSNEEVDLMEEDAEEEEKVKLKPMVLKPMTGKGKATSKVEGVGAGALQAAARHGTFDLKSLATWPAGKPVPYAFLVDTFEAIAETTKRLLIIQMLVNAFRAIIATTPEDLLPTVYLCSDRVAPAHTGIELGVGEAILIKSLAHVTGRKEAIIKKQYEESGDLGMVAVQNKATQSTMFKPAPLTVAAVYKTFKEISMAAGQSSQEKKKGLIVKLLVASAGSEAGYIMRSLQGKLRIGLAEQSVLVALAHAVLLQRENADNKKGDLADRLEQAAQIVKAAYSECPSYDKLVPALLEHGVAALPQHCHFMPGVPVRPMLAKATNGVSEVLDKFQDCEFTCEYKYDGERAQIHVLEDGKVQIYSRNAEDTTTKYIDVSKRMKSLLKPDVKSIVIDSEVVAYDRETKRILPFQVLSTRARKDVNEKDIKVQVCSFAFDCLYLNGRALLKEPLTARREALYSALKEQEGVMQFAVTKVSRDVEELETFLNDSVEHGTEGLIVKTLADTYEPSKRSSHWLKLKKDYLDGVGDTFDVVPVGAWHGKGKRTGLFGAYLLAIYDPDSETFQTISKLGTGFSEEVLKELADSLREHIIDKPKSYYTWGDAQEPDVWFNPVTVWEVKAADLSISPVHKAAVGMVDPVKGISIRFPRLMRVRDDKKPEDATTPEQVADMYKRQAVVNSQKKKTADDDEE